MNLTEAAYLIVYGDGEPWRNFATQHLGAMASGDDSSLYIRLDELKYRILVLPQSAGDGAKVALGWATSNRHEFSRCRQALNESGTSHRDGTDDECAVRGVAGLLLFQDPAGNRHEICWGRTQVGHPFISPAGITFVTGPLGFGHAVLPAGDRLDDTLAFYEDVLGLTVSDFFRATTPDGAPGPRVNFLHPDNNRQHSLGIAEFPPDAGINHFMVQVGSIDEVGRMLDRAYEAGIVVRSLGRHVNDRIISFYMRTPAGFHVEYGYGAQNMDWEHHDVRTITPGTLWGHRWL